MARKSKKFQGTALPRYIKQFRKAGQSPLVVAHGGDPMLLDELLAAAKGLVDEATRDFNFDIFHGDDLDPGRLAAALGALPMMSERRVVVVRHADSLTPSVQKYLKDYAANPVDSTIAMLLFDATGPPKAWVSELADRGDAVDCSTPSGAALRDWIKGEAERLGTVVEPEAVEMMVEGRDATLIELAGELLKASLLIDEGEAISLEVLQQVWGIEPEVDIWGLFDQIASGKRYEALLGLEAIGDELDKQSGFIIAQVSRRLRLVWKERVYDARRIPFAQRSWSGSTKWQWSKASAELKSMRGQVALQRLRRLLEIDRLRKSANYDFGHAAARFVHETALARRGGDS